jgi:hypothetical protein
MPTKCLIQRDPPSAHGNQQPITASGREKRRDGYASTRLAQTDVHPLRLNIFLRKAPFNEGSARQ